MAESYENKITRVARDLFEELKNNPNASLEDLAAAERICFHPAIANSIDRYTIWNEYLALLEARGLTRDQVKSSPEIRELREKLTRELAASLHDEWRAARLNSETGEYEPRLKPTQDATWIASHAGLRECDIANTPFSDLPAEWKADNEAAAITAVDTVLSFYREYPGQEFSNFSLEQGAAVIHEAWLKRNIDRAEEAQKVPYAKLSESEKEKDRLQERVALMIYQRAQEIDAASPTPSPSL
jgi:hypothetical protein